MITTLTDSSRHAARWSGTAASFVDLHPPAATESSAVSVFHGIQAGSATINGKYHAGIWSGEADTWMDLHSFLPPEFSKSFALSVWSDSWKVVVVGWGFNERTARCEALLWTRKSCTVDFDHDGFVTGNDYDAFVVEFYAGNDAADFDANGFVTGDDFDAYVIAFEAGC